MNFKTDKKGYCQKEVDSYLIDLSREYSSVTEAQRIRIDELRRSLSNAESKIADYKNKTGQITKAILGAVEKADEIEKLSRQKYNQEIARLRAFHEKWIAYYYRILEKYPIDDDLQEAGEFGMNVRKILASAGNSSNSGSAKIPEQLERTFDSERKRLADKQIGYITVKTDESDSSDDFDTLLKMVPGADPSSMVLSANPLERIRKYLASEKAKEQVSGAKPKTKSPKRKKGDESAATLSGSGAYDFSDFDKIEQKAPAHPLDIHPSDSGFSFGEALNPTDDLATIMKDLGLLFE